MENVNEYSKSIGLGTTFRNILWKNDKTINFFDDFLYFSKNYVKLFLKWFINKNSVNEHHKISVK